MVKKYVLLNHSKNDTKIVSVNTESCYLNYTDVSPHTAQSGHWGNLEVLWLRIYGGKGEPPTLMLEGNGIENSHSGEQCAASLNNEKDNEIKYSLTPVTQNKFQTDLNKKPDTIWLFLREITGRTCFDINPKSKLFYPPLILMKNKTKQTNNQLIWQHSAQQRKSWQKEKGQASKWDFTPKCRNSSCSPI